ncbi:unnamed protein product, partial [Tetraodon nigroviridis]
FQNSIRHNLSLHSRFIRVQNEGTGKSSWWMINPEGGRGGKAPRRRAVSMDNSNKYIKSARGETAKKKAVLQASAAAGDAGGDSPSGPSKWPGSPTSRSSEEPDTWTDFRSRTNSNASTLSGRLSPIMANPELNEAPDDERPISPMLYSSPGRALSPGNAATNGKSAPAELPRLADLTGTMNLNDGLTDDLMDDLLENINLVPTVTGQPALNGSSGFTFVSKPNRLGSTSSTTSPSSNSSPNCGMNGYTNSIFGPHKTGSSLCPSPMQTIQENKQTSFSSISLARFGSQTLQDLLNADSHNHSDVMMTQGAMVKWCKIDPSIFLNGTSSGGICQDRFPTDLDLDIFNSSLECDMDSIIRNELMDTDGLDFNFDSLANMTGVGNLTSTKQASQTWVP